MKVSFLSSLNRQTPLHLWRQYEEKILSGARTYHQILNHRFIFQILNIPMTIMPMNSQHYHEPGFRVSSKLRLGNRYSCAASASCRERALLNEKAPLTDPSWVLRLRGIWRTGSKLVLLIPHEECIYGRLGSSTFEPRIVTPVLVTPGGSESLKRGRCDYDSLEALRTDLDQVVCDASKSSAVRKMRNSEGLSIATELRNGISSLRYE